MSSSKSATDPASAPVAPIDRFSATAAKLMVRTAANGLPGPNAPIDFDSGAPFITTGRGPAGQIVKYYNFDVQSTTPAPIYAFFRKGASMPIDGQLNVVGVIPGDAGYNDFWAVQKVTVPDGYVANSVTSVADVTAAGYPVEDTGMLVNCPIVPKGSTAMLRYDAESPGLTRGWYQGTIVYYFNFFEVPIVPVAGRVPTSPIYVTFNVNPDPTVATSGPASGFEEEPGTMQTHNVPATLPGDAGYSPLWAVHIYDDADFAKVMDLPTALAAKLLQPNGPTVNCPIVSVH